jgi:hypothetical protein
MHVRIKRHKNLINNNAKYCVYDYGLLFYYYRLLSRYIQIYNLLYCFYQYPIIISVLNMILALMLTTHVVATVIVVLVVVILTLL